VKSEVWLRSVELADLIREISERLKAGERITLASLDPANDWRVGALLVHGTFKLTDDGFVQNK
jgi:hypothetical protein